MLFAQPQTLLKIVKPRKEGTVAFQLADNEYTIDMALYGTIFSRKSKSIIIAWPYHGRYNQRFEVINLEGSTFQLKIDNKCMTAMMGYVDAIPCSSVNQLQTFKFIKAGEYYNLKPQKTRGIVGSLFENAESSDAEEATHLDDIKKRGTKIWKEELLKSFQNSKDEGLVDAKKDNIARIIEHMSCKTKKRRK